MHAPCMPPFYYESRSHLLYAKFGVGHRINPTQGKDQPAATYVPERSNLRSEIKAVRFLTFPTFFFLPEAILTLLLEWLIEGYCAWKTIQ